MSVLRARSLIIFLSFVVAVLAGPLATVGVQQKADVSYRLPNDTRPITYDIHLTTRVDEGNLNFTGNVVIVLESIQTTNDIVLHARQLTIKDIKLETAQLTEPQVIPVTFKYDEITEFLTIHSEQQLSASRYRLEINYSGKLRQDNGGFYVSKYSDDDGKEWSIATTQFESTDARHGFPCYDEPAKKAAFAVKITHGSTYTAISNNPVLGEPVDNGDGTKTTQFVQTKPMSTYLVAFIVSNFVDMHLQNRTMHGIYSRPHTQPIQMMALENSVKILNSIEDYLDVKYKFPKMDNVAVPDFSAGAMENWGLVTYREEILLFDEKQSTTSTELSIISVIGHEFGHQWFGDLVSPLWWTYLWLNEGFASIFAYIAFDDVHPEWDIWQDFLVSDFMRALQADGKANPRPMTHYVESPKEISGIFDSVVYSKAASVLIMIRNVISDPTFKKALTHYLNKMEYESAEEDNLFASFEVAIKEDKTPLLESADIRKLFKSWSNQGGYPLITVTRDYDKGTFEIKQEPFDGTDKVASGDTRSWWVPFNFATAKNPHFKQTHMFDYLNVGEKSKIVSQTADEKWEKSDWIVLNKYATSYYRVNYDLENWKLLTRALTKDVAPMNVHNRAVLLEDCFRLVMAKRLKFDTCLDLSLFMKIDVEYAPWVVTNSYLTTLNTYLSGDDEYELFQYYVQSIVGPFYRIVGTVEGSNDAKLRKLSRSIAVNWACRSNYGDCVEQTNKRVLEFVSSGKQIEPNLRNTILCNGLAKATESQYNFIINYLMNSKDQAVRRQLMSSAIGCIQNPELLKRYLLTSIQHVTPVNYREQERLNVVTGVVDKGPAQLAAAIDFLIENHAAYSKLTTDFLQTNPLLLAIRNIAGRIVSKEQETHFEKLLNELKGYTEIKEADLTSVRATVKSNLDWIAEYRPGLIDWLRKYKQNGGNGEGEEGGDGAATIVVSTGAIVAIVFVSLRELF